MDGRYELEAEYFSRYDYELELRAEHDDPWAGYEDYSETDDQHEGIDGMPKVDCLKYKLVLSSQTSLPTFSDRDDDIPF